MSAKETNLPKIPLVEHLDRSSTDAALIQAIAGEKNEEALETLANRHGKAIFNLALFILGDEALAEDVVQETTLSLWRCARTYNPARGQGRSWLLRMAAHKAIRLKTRLRKKETLLDRYRSTLPALAPDSPGGTEALDALRALLSQLPDLDRQMVALYFGAGCSQDEIAVALRIPQRTISGRLAQALGGLRSGLKQAGFGAAVCGPELLNEALCAGWPTPTVLCRASELILVPTTQNTAGSLRLGQALSAVGAKASRLLLAAPLCCGVLWYGLVLAQGKLQPAATPGISVAPAASAPSTGAPQAGTAAGSTTLQPFKRYWNFDSLSQLNEFELFLSRNPGLGQFSYSARDGLGGGGCLRAKPCAILELPIHPGDLPLRISLKIRFLNAPKGQYPGLAWSWLRYATGEFQNLRGGSVLPKAGPWYEYRFYLTETAIDSWMAEAGRYHVSCIDDLGDLGPATQLRLHCNFSGLVDEVTAEHCAAEVIPDLSEFHRANLLLYHVKPGPVPLPVPGLDHHALPGQQVLFRNCFPNIGWQAFWLPDVQERFR